MNQPVSEMQDAGVPVQLFQVQVQNGSFGGAPLQRRHVRMKPGFPAGTPDYVGKRATVPMEKTVCIRPDICGGYIRFHKTALFHKKTPHGSDHVFHVQHGGTSRIGGFPAAFPVFRPWKKRSGIGAGFRSRLAFLPDFKLVFRLHFPENRSFLPPGPA